MTARSHSRRQTLALGGGALTLALAGGCLRTANAEGRALAEGDAYAPWSLWNDPSVRGTPLALVAAAVLAANPHDTKPWLFRIGDDAIDVFADLSRNLGAMDAYVREMHLGLGCAIENMLTAAGPNGYDAKVEAAEGSLANLAVRRGPVAAASLRLKKRPPSAPDDFYRAIALRHTNRYAYERAKPAPAGWLEFARQAGSDEGALVIQFDEGEDRRAFDAVVVDATQAIIEDKIMIGDSDHWFRSSRAERLAEAALERHRARARHAAAQPADRDDRPRTPDRARRSMGEAHRAPDRRRVASHVLVSRRLRVAPCAAEPEAQAQGYRVGVTRPSLRTV